MDIDTNTHLAALAIAEEAFRVRIAAHHNDSERTTPLFRDKWVRSVFVAASLKYTNTIRESRIGSATDQDVRGALYELEAVTRRTFNIRGAYSKLQADELNIGGMIRTALNARAGTGGAVIRRKTWSELSKGDRLGPWLVHSVEREGEWTTLRMQNTRSGSWGSYDRLSGQIATA